VSETVEQLKKYIQSLIMFFDLALNVFPKQLVTCYIRCKCLVRVSGSGFCTRVVSVRQYVTPISVVADPGIIAGGVSALSYSAVKLFSKYNYVFQPM